MRRRHWQTDLSNRAGRITIKQDHPEVSVFVKFWLCKKPISVNRIAAPLLPALPPLRAGADMMHRYYLYNNSLPFHCSGIRALSQLGRLSSGERIFASAMILSRRILYGILQAEAPGASILSE
jgi:hypothetical protein